MDKTVETFLAVLITGYIIICGPSLVFGMLMQMESGCTYHSIMSHANLGYFIGCELMQDRF